MVQEKGLVSLDVTADDAQQEVCFTHQRVALENLRVLAHGLLEFQQGVAAMAGQLYARKHCDVQADFLTVQHRDAMLYDTQFLKPAHAPPAGRRGHSHPFGHVRRGQITVLLQHIENA